MVETTCLPSSSPIGQLVTLLILLNKSKLPVTWWEAPESISQQEVLPFKRLRESFVDEWSSELRKCCHYTFGIPDKMLLKYWPWSISSLWERDIEAITRGICVAIIEEKEKKNYLELIE